MNNCARKISLLYFILPRLLSKGKPLQGKHSWSCTRQSLSCNTLLNVDSWNCVTVSTACICSMNHVSEQLIAKKSHFHRFRKLFYLTSSCFWWKYLPVGQVWSYTRNAAREKSRQLFLSRRKARTPVSSPEETVHSSARAVLITVYF